MIRYGELDQAITAYTRADAHERIPVEYYRRVIKIAISMNNAGKQWDMQQSAAVLLYLAFSEGHLQPSQLTTSGLNALDYAEMLMQVNEINIDPVTDTGNVSLKLVDNK